MSCGKRSQEGMFYLGTKETNVDPDHAPASDRLSTLEKTVR